MDSNTKLRHQLEEALGHMAERPGECRTQISKLFSDLCDDRKALAGQVENAKRDLETAHRENGEFQVRGRQDRVRIEQLEQQLRDAKFAAEERPAPPVRGYDVEMIRDFLDHLLWEVRIVHFESTAAVGTINPELVDLLARYTKKRRAVLMAVVRVDTEGVTAQQGRRACEYWRVARAGVAEEQIGWLEKLQPLFKEGFRCIEIGVKNGLPTHTIHALDLLPPEEGGNAAHG